MGFGIQLAGLNSAIQAAIPDANARLATTHAVLPENEVLRPDGTLSAIPVTYDIHPPHSTPWTAARAGRDSSKTGYIMRVKLRHNRDKPWLGSRYARTVWTGQFSGAWTQGRRPFPSVPVHAASGW